MLRDVRAVRDALLASGGWLEDRTVASRTGLTVRAARRALTSLTDTGMAEKRPGHARQQWRIPTDKMQMARAI